MILAPGLSPSKPAPGSARQPGTLADDLLAGWLFNEGAGLRSNDSGPHGLSGLLKGGATFAARPEGSVVSLAATSKYVAIADDNRLKSLQVPLTICGFAHTNATTSQTIFGQYKTAVSSQLIKLLRVDSAFLRYWVGRQSDGTYQFVDGPAWTAGIGHFFAVVMSGSLSSATVRIWVDGQVITGTYASALLTSPDLTVQVNLGAGQDGTTEFLDGSIAWLYVFKRDLRDGEVMALRADPFRLFRPRRVTRGVTTITPTFRPAWAAGSNRLISGGIAGG